MGYMRPCLNSNKYFKIKTYVYKGKNVAQCSFDSSTQKNIKTWNKVKIQLTIQKGKKQFGFFGFFLGGVVCLLLKIFSKSLELMRPVGWWLSGHRCSLLNLTTWVQSLGFSCWKDTQFPKVIFCPPCVHMSTAPLPRVKCHFQNLTVL